MWTLLVLNLALGSMSSIPGFSTPDNCRNAGTQLQQNVQTSVPDTRMGWFCIKVN